VAEVVPEVALEVATKVLEQAEVVNLRLMLRISPHWLEPCKIKSATYKTSNR